MPFINTYSIQNTLLRETKSTIWRARITKTIPKIKDLKDRMIRQTPTLLLVIRKPKIREGLGYILAIASEYKKHNQHYTVTKSHQQNQKNLQCK